MDNQKVVHLRSFLKTTCQQIASVAKFMPRLNKADSAWHKGWDDNVQRLCTIKENLQVISKLQKQFKREAVMLANFNHPR